MSLDVPVLMSLLSSAVVLIAVNCATGPIETFVQHRAVVGGELATIARPHPLFLVCDRLLAMLQSSGFAWGERAGFDALLNALLLISFAPIDAGTGR